jgi:hypothetical protein
VDRRHPETRQQQPESCIRQPDPAVIMTNQIIAGLAVDSLRRLLDGQETPPIFYDARGDYRL